MHIFLLTLFGLSAATPVRDAGPGAKSLAYGMQHTHMHAVLFRVLKHVLRKHRSQLPCRTRPHGIMFVRGCRWAPNVQQLEGHFPRRVHQTLGRTQARAGNHARPSFLFSRWICGRPYHCSYVLPQVPQNPQMAASLDAAHAHEQMAGNQISLLSAAKAGMRCRCTRLQ